MKIPQQITNLKAFPVGQAVLAELHETEPIHAKAAVMTVFPAGATEPIRAAVALGVQAHVRCAKEPIRAMAAAKIHGVRPDAMAADHSCAAFQCVMAADRTDVEFPSAKDDPHHCSAMNAAYSPNPLKECCVRFPASCATEPGFVRRFGIRFRAAVGRDEQSAHPECASAAWRSFRRFASACCDPAKRRSGCHDLAIRRASDANRLQLLHFGSGQPSGRNSEPDDVQSQVIPIAGRFPLVRLSTHESARLARV